MNTLLIATLSLIGAFTPQRGLVTGVSVEPATVETGQQVSITVTGNNPCGAVRVNPGDGAVTHAITALPSTHAHTYRRPGKYTVVAEGMGNCDGVATTTIQVTGRPLDPDPPPAPRAQITNVEMTPAPGRVREPVTFTISGNGPCEISVEFGDGNSRRLSGDLPQRTTYTYAVARRYTVVVRPVAPCEGRFTQVLDVVEPQPSGQLVRVAISPAPATVGQPVSLRIEGTGRCVYSVNFGDGNAESHEAELPQTLTRYYQAPGMYTVTATPRPPCRGGDRVTFEVRGVSAPSGTNISGIDVSPPRPSSGAQVTVFISGTGECRVSVDFGDGNRRTYVGTLPFRVPHIYDAPGRYSVEAAAEAPCSGSRRADVEVTRRVP